MIKGAQGEGQLRTCLGQRALKSKDILVTAPSGSSLSGFLFGGEKQQKTNKAKRERGKSRPGGAFSLTWALMSLHGSDLHIPARAVPAAGVRGCVGESGGLAGCVRPLICRAGGGRRAGGLGAVCNFAASVAAVPGERAPALAPIGRRCVSWCDLLLSLLAFGHPETNQFDDY